MVWKVLYYVGFISEETFSHGSIEGSFHSPSEVVVTVASQTGWKGVDGVFTSRLNELGFFFVEAKSLISVYILLWLGWVVNIVKSVSADLKSQSGRGTGNVYADTSFFRFGIGDAAKDRLASYNSFLIDRWTAIEGSFSCYFALFLLLEVNTISDNSLQEVRA
jgi:hypothetical protein